MQNKISKYLTDKGINSPYLNYAKNIYSQNGEDGIVEKIFQDLGITKGNVVEFGAWDGIYLSNVCNLWKNKNFNALLIEGSDEAMEGIKVLGRNNIVEAYKLYVSENPNDKYSLDNILSFASLNFMPDNFSLLSIDVDGKDYQIFESLTKFRPKVILIETTYKHKGEYMGEDGCSLQTLNKLAIHKGYRLVCHNLNGIFVREDLYHNIESKFGDGNDGIDLEIPLEDILVLQKLNENGEYSEDSPIRYLTEEYNILVINEMNEIH